MFCGSCAGVAFLNGMGMTLQEFSLKTGVDVSDILGSSRVEGIAIAREIYWYILNRQGMGCRRISKIAGRSKQTVLSGIRTAKNLIDTNHRLVERYRELI